MSPYICLSKQFCANDTPNKDARSDYPVITNKVTHIHNEYRSRRQLHRHIFEYLSDLGQDVGKHKDGDTDHGHDNNRWINKRPADFRKEIMFLLKLKSQNIEYFLQVPRHFSHTDHVNEKLIEDVWVFG